MQRITALVVVLVALLGYTIATKEQAPKWTPPSPATNPNVVFVETFDNNWSDRWTISKDPKFTGKWEVREGDAPYGVAGSEGLVVSTPAAHHGIITKFPKVLHNENKDLIVQFEFRSQKFLDCGGGYIKLVRADEMPENLENFAADTPYTIMFGPDKCGSTNKVHFIFNHESPVTKKFEEKHFVDAPQWKNDKLTHLYTLEVRKDNTVFLYIDQELVKNGTLLASFKPTVNPAKEIDDPTDSKPADWVDEETIADPDAKKPDDWDEDAPAEIDDPNDKKPEGWLDNEPSEIPDPEAKKPVDWSDEEDGEWEAVTISNPKCDEFGCGEWKPARIANPAYKGKWVAPRVPNPAYKGPWKARQIPNPEFFEDTHPHNFKDIGGLGIELWTVTEGQMFSNIIITHDKAIADDFAAHTFVKRHEQELKIQEEENAKNQPSAVTQALGWITQTLESLQHNPVALGGVGVALGVIPVILYFACRSSKSDEPAGEERIGEKKEEVKDEPKKEDDKEVKEEKKTPAKSGTRRRLDN